MPLITSILSRVMKKRIHQIELFFKYPLEVQNELLENLVDKARNTEYGKKHHFHEIKNSNDFRERVPLVSYEDFYPYIKRSMQGEKNIFWPSDITWYAKSSGTTNARSKFIPVSQEAMDDCHYKGGKDLMSIYLNNNPGSRVFSGKGLIIGGSQQVNQFDEKQKSFYGDVSAVLLKNLPFWIQLIRTPSLEIALMDEWESKIEKIAEATYSENVTNISGVPTWTLVLLERILEKYNKKSILEIWPNLELFVHGAVSFIPYRSLFEKLIPSHSMNYLETYNASEGFFAIQDRSESSELLLMLDYGIYYEFIPMEKWEDDYPATRTLNEVELNKNYAMVISTNAGLWRYKIGDTIKFTALNPFRIKITGRTKHFINAFGEELIIDNAEHAISIACTETGAEIDNFTAAPRYLGSKQKGGHEWIIEFISQPSDHEKFKVALDNSLREINSDYDAKRHKEIALQPPVIHNAPKGTFKKWLKDKGKLGGQNKVPRLANDRQYVEEILKYLN